MSGFTLFGQFSKGDPFRSPDVIWGTAGLALALLAGALLVYLTDRWRKKSSSQIVDTSRELTEFRRMFESGEITAEEYAKLRDRVALRVKAPAPVPATDAVQLSQQAIANRVPDNPNSLPGPDQPTPPPDSGKPANPSSPA
jgi:hypothetical protein